MQSYSLTIDKFLDHAAKWSADREVVIGGTKAPFGRIGYAALRERANRMSGALSSLGVGIGDCIGTLAWNTQHHLEIYYAAMGAGMVCHTLNPRLTAAHLAAMINEAQERVLAAAHDLAPLVAEVARLCPRLEHVVFLDVDGDTTPPVLSGVRTWNCETLLLSHDGRMEWGGFDEQSPAGLCYTSGTTGRPKGVLYSHRSNYLHTLRLLQADAFALTSSDSILMAVPMFHANAWGLPFAAPGVGAKLVLPGRRTEGASLAHLMREEGVTVAAGVQTVWLGLVEHLEATGEELPQLERVIIGGSNCPEAQIRRMEERLGARVQATWGMTELSPLGTIVPLDRDPSERRSSGRPTLGLDLKLADPDGATLPEQRGPLGRLMVKGHSVIDRYFKADADALDSDGYFDTGDLATIDEAGNLTLCGRSKELIKSGGEWINPAEIEDIVGGHSGVSLVAVIGRQHPRWGERPVLVVERRQGHTVDGEELLETLRGKVASWWAPDDVVFVEAMPLAATGKIDKNRLRADYAAEDDL